MKKIISIVFTFSLLILITIFWGCGKPQADKTGNDKLKIVCTIFPQYDWVRQILGSRIDSVELTLLINSRVDLHSYQPSVQDVAKISNSDLFIFIGGDSDGWVDNVLMNAVNPNIVAIDLLDALGSAAKMEAVVEGMQKSSHDHGHSHGNESDKGTDKHHHHKNHDKKHGNDEHDEHDEHEHAHSDEHIWLSLKNAQTLGAVIMETLSSLDEKNAEYYKSNWKAYSEKLSELDGKYQAAVNAASVKTLLFADRFPFRYLMDDYGLSYYAAFTGCSAETEASFETIMFLAKKVDELKLRSVMVTESADKSIARTVVNNSRKKNQQVLVLDAMQSVTSADVRNGADYLSIMESNLNVLKEGLK